MATTLDFVEYVRGQIEGVGAVRHKKMFGEYMVYVDDKPILLVCDDTVFVKMRPETETILSSAEKGFPYNGAKEHYVLDIDNVELSKAVVEALLPVTPLPKLRKK
jgi:TfoX/Sxy family transcriptional regulator of competence genes